MDSAVASPKPPFRWLRMAFAVGLLVALAVGVRWALREKLEPRHALALLRSVQDNWWAMPAFVATYVGATALFLPAVLFTMVSGATWGFGQGLALNFLAVNGSASLQFLFARWLGRAWFERFLPKRQLLLFDGAAARHGFRAVVAVRMLPLPHMAVNVAGGVSALRWRDFAFGSALGTLPITLVYTYFAARLVEGAAGAERAALLQTVAAAALVLAFTFVPRLLARLRSRQATTPE